LDIMLCSDHTVEKKLALELMRRTYVAVEKSYLLS
jgi:hypothetical protein